MIHLCKWKRCRGKVPLTWESKWMPKAYASALAFFPGSSRVNWALISRPEPVDRTWINPRCSLRRARIHGTLWQYLLRAVGCCTQSPSKWLRPFDQSPSCKYLVGKRLVMLYALNRSTTVNWLLSSLLAISLRVISSSEGSADGEGAERGRFWSGSRNRDEREARDGSLPLQNRKLGQRCRYRNKESEASMPIQHFHGTSTMVCGGQPFFALTPKVGWILQANERVGRSPDASSTDELPPAEP